jgi:hypothetical protein
MKQNNNSIHNKTADTTRGLIITTQEKQMLSKQQQTFNRLVIKIEKLRQELEQTNNILNKN